MNLFCTVITLLITEYSAQESKRSVEENRYIESSTKEYKSYLVILEDRGNAHFEAALQKQPMIFPEDYDKFEAPRKGGQPANVYISLSLLEIYDVDEEKMEFSLHLYMYEFWKDYRVNFSTFDIRKKWPVLLPPHFLTDLWVPDLAFDNVKDGERFHLSLSNEAICLRKDGFLQKFTRYNFIVSCRMDFHYYPMDTQTCVFKISTYFNTDYEVLLHWINELYTERKSIQFRNVQLKPLKYEIASIQPSTVTEIWPIGNYTLLLSNFTFVRRVNAAIFNVYIPSCLVVVLSWISFWIDVEAVPARITLGLTSLLTLATQVEHAQTGLPAISYLTAMDIWLLVCLISMFAILIEFAVAYRYAIQEKEEVTINARRFSEKKLDLNRIQNSRYTSNRNSENADQSTSKRALKNPSRSKNIDRISRFIFPSLFFVFAIVYWIYFLNF